MGLKTLLSQQGIIEQDSEYKIIEKFDSDNYSQQPDSIITPMLFPPAGIGEFNSIENSCDISFSSPVPSDRNVKELLDPTFIKFFEDELTRANLPGSDYYDFRKLLIKTEQKMSMKGISAPDIILQTVLLSFEVQNVTASKLISTAQQYKDILKQKKDDFLNGALIEKNNQLQKRQNVIHSHNEAISKIEQQLQQLQMLKLQLEESLNKEKTQIELSKTIGKDVIEKIEKAEMQIGLSYDFMESSIDADISKLKNN
jgi:hypothetical protein